MVLMEHPGLTLTVSPDWICIAVTSFVVGQTLFVLMVPMEYTA